MSHHNLKQLHPFLTQLIYPKNSFSTVTSQYPYLSQSLDHGLSSSGWQLPRCSRFLLMGPTPRFLVRLLTTLPHPRDPWVGCWGFPQMGRRSPHQE